MRYRNLVIVGTSHIARESISEVEGVILREMPAVVALELDSKRLAALLHPEMAKMSWKDIRRVGFKGWLFGLVGAWVEHKLGERVGVRPGSEMLQAFNAARMVQARIVLIDQDIEVTLRRFSKALGFREKWRLLVDLFKGLVLRKSEFGFDLSTVPGKRFVGRMISRVRKRYPNIYRVLVSERNEVMARRLARLMQSFPDQVVVAVVGAGHEKSIIQLVKKELS